LKKPPVEGWLPEKSRQPVHIPNADGSAVAETLWVEVDAWRDPATGEIFLDGEANARLEAVKARYLGVLTPTQLHDMRAAIGASQKKMADLLQLGEKSWTRWETGRERPSRSMNVLLCALYDGKIDVNYLETLADPSLHSQFARWKPSIRLETKPATVAEPKALYGESAP
jgi:DNA-binding transcriptional regulator YiaG